MQTTNSHPTLHDHRKDECGICLKIVNDADKAIECDKCQSWIHIKCNKLTVNNTNISKSIRMKNLNASIVLAAKFAIEKWQQIITQLNVIFVRNGFI